MDSIPNARPDEASKAPAMPLPKRRLRIDKLEERIAPKKGGNTKHCSATTGAGSSGTSY